jgi:hypothetical protein
MFRIALILTLILSASLRADVVLTDTFNGSVLDNTKWDIYTSPSTPAGTAGVNSVLSNPNLWTLYTTSQIQNMAVGDLVLSRQVNGGFVLNYDIEQSTDLQTWTPYQALSLPMTNLPTDKAFVRIKAKQ